MSSQGWREIGKSQWFMRSVWESNYARYLQWLFEHGEILAWEHEPQTFWFLNIKRGVRSYLPDFKVYRPDNTHYWVEVKGYMDAKSKTKLKRFKKYYPDEELLLIDGKWFRASNAKWRLIIKDWEKGDAPRERQKQVRNWAQYQRNGKCGTFKGSKYRSQSLASA